MCDAVEIVEEFIHQHDKVSHLEDFRLSLGSFSLGNVLC